MVEALIGITSSLENARSVTDKQAANQEVVISVHESVRCLKGDITHPQVTIHLPISTLYKSL